MVAFLRLSLSWMCLPCICCRRALQGAQGLFVCVFCFVQYICVCVSVYVCCYVASENVKYINGVYIYKFVYITLQLAAVGSDRESVFYISVRSAGLCVARSRVIEADLVCVVRARALQGSSLNLNTYTNFFIHTSSISSSSSHHCKRSFVLPPQSIFYRVFCLFCVLFVLLRIHIRTYLKVMKGNIEKILCALRI